MSSALTQRELIMHVIFSEIVDLTLRLTISLQEKRNRLVLFLPLDPILSRSQNILSSLPHDQQAKWKYVTKLHNFAYNFT